MSSTPKVTHFVFDCFGSRLNPTIALKSCIIYSVVRLLREELQLLQEQGSYVGEVVKAMDKKKVLVKVRVFYSRRFFCNFMILSVTNVLV